MAKAAVSNRPELSGDRGSGPAIKDGGRIYRLVVG